MLDWQGLLRGVHGFAVPVGPLAYEPAGSARVYFTEEKDRIARAPLEYLPQDGAVRLLDAGSTTVRLAELLPIGRRLRVYTNTRRSPWPSSTTCRSPSRRSAAGSGR